MQAAVMVPGPQGGAWDIREVQRPAVPPGHILARVYASSLNRAEMRAMHNLRSEAGKPTPADRIGGGDAAGEIVELGDGVGNFKPGDRVMGRCSGGFAEYVLIDAREAMPAPARLGWEAAAAVPIVYVVVHDALFASAQLHAGETVMVTAASSGVGVATLQLAKLIGARVIGTSRSSEKIEKLKDYGLDAGVVTGSDGFAAAIAGIIGENGVDMIVDNIGGDVFPACLEALAVGGRFVTIGRMSGVLKGELDLDRLALRRLHLYGVSNRLRPPAQRAQSTARFIADLMPALQDGRLEPIVDRVFPLRDIAAAQAYLEADRHVGKVVIRVQ
jgi:NADPH:quinone reductase